MEIVSEDPIETSENILMKKDFIWHIVLIFGKSINFGDIENVVESFFKTIPSHGLVGLSVTMTQNVLSRVAKIPR